MCALFLKQEWLPGCPTVTIDEQGVVESVSKQRQLSDRYQLTSNQDYFVIFS